MNEDFRVREVVRGEYKEESESEITQVERESQSNSDDATRMATESEPAVIADESMHCLVMQCLM